MTLQIDGLDITPYVAFGGLQWQREDLEGPDAGRDLTGTLRRNRLTTKVRLDVTCRPLTGSEASTLLTAILPEYVLVTYFDPQEGKTVTKRMYSDNNPATFALRQEDGTELWSGISFPLTEV